MNFTVKYVESVRIARKCGNCKKDILEGQPAASLVHPHPPYPKMDLCSECAGASAGLLRWLVVNTGPRSKGAL